MKIHWLLYFLFVYQGFFIPTVYGQPLDTVLVVIDKKTEDKIGVLPYQRDVLAQGIKKLKSLGAKEILLKFFIDRPKDKEADKKLALALASIPVTIQTRSDNQEPVTNTLPPKFLLPQNYASVSSSLDASSGWIPLNMFSEQAYAVGFIDSIYPAFLVQKYQKKLVSSLQFQALQSIFGQKFEVRGKNLWLGDKQIHLNDKHVYVYPWLNNKNVPYISYLDLIEGRVKPDAINQKYVVFGYNGYKIHKIPTLQGEMNAHLAFYQSLISMVADLK